MAKYVTIELRLPNDADVYSDATQEGLLNAVSTFESVVSARVVGLGEGPDPEDEPVAPEQNVPENPANQDGGEPDNADGEGQMEPSGESPTN